MTFLYIILAESKAKDESSESSHNVKENQTDNQIVDNKIINRKRKKSKEPDVDGNENPTDDAEITSMSCYYFKL